MKKIKVYIDTSVFGGCFDRIFEQDSNKLFSMMKLGIYDCVISTVTADELADAPKNVRSIPDDFEFEILSLSEEAVILASKYLEEGIISAKYTSDCQHIAIATINNVDVLVSWNFKHIVNLSKIKQFNSVNLKEGYKELEIRSPKELIHE